MRPRTRVFVVIVCLLAAVAVGVCVPRVLAGEVCAGFGRITRVQLIEDGRRVVVTDDGLLGAVQAWTQFLDNWTSSNGGYFIHQLEAVEEIIWVDTDAGRRLLIVYGSFSAPETVFPTAFPNLRTIHPCSAGIMPRAAFEAWVQAALESE